ncbi:hypothetical protein OUY18_04340 [Caproiciproducens galactitolivorans]|uniref:Uncharacterized protein n=1 Tax=Caproiciproducens galactitolivorans TaxID=642589 RepID=A0ABT4BT37_9FIRM|nr:hypothetical protein [Caproiciproducens galactitolivorans]MCY1713485.1 hypothetical protein [Caproiciproducens galactitolivorans]
MVLLLFGILNSVLTSLCRIALHKLLRHLRAKGYNLKHVTIRENG